MRLKDQRPRIPATRHRGSQLPGVRLRLKRIPRELRSNRNLPAPDFRFPLPTWAGGSPDGNASHNNQSVIGNVQNPDEATLDQVLSRSPRWPPDGRAARAANLVLPAEREQNDPLNK